MENKKDLAKIAFTALILASAIPMNGHADLEAHGIVLAAGCAAHGCPAKNGAAPQANETSYYEDYRKAHEESFARPSEYGMSNFNRGNVAGPQGDHLPTGAPAKASTTLTENQLLGMLNPQGRSIYLSLDSEAKALAIQLASQETYRDKNLAVKEAQRRMNERRSFNR